MKALALMAAMAAAMAGSAAAQVAVGDCDSWVANARNVAWSQPSRTYANGAIRLVALDTEEPAVAAFHLMILFLPSGQQEGPMYQDCRLISVEAGGFGFAGLDLGGPTARYDPATGLTIDVPVTRATADGDIAADILSVTINRATGTVEAR